MMLMFTGFVDDPENNLQTWTGYGILGILALSIIFNILQMGMISFYNLRLKLKKRKYKAYVKQKRAAELEKMNEQMR